MKRKKRIVARCVSLMEKGGERRTKEREREKEKESRSLRWSLPRSPWSNILSPLNEKEGRGVEKSGREIRSFGDEQESIRIRLPRGAAVGVRASHFLTPRSSCIGLLLAVKEKKGR